ncbi:MAG: glycosyltransferase family 87 protein [Nitrospiraceae bacterium]|nr:glycosyltransferase family 87 protein [Nitrospiraceae bacterium]
MILPSRPGTRVALYRKAAFSVWGAALAIICVLVYLDPLKRTVTPIYAGAVKQWISRTPLYSEYLFHYPPQFIFLFMPFHAMPSPLGDIMWRILSAVLLVWGLWRIMSLAPSLRDGRLFLCAALVMLLPSLAAIRNGQANLIFSALTIHAAACIALSQWWLATLCLVLSLAAKGAIGFVMIFLAALIYRTLIWRIGLGLLVFLAIPFLFSDTSYVLSQYRQYLEHLAALSVNQRQFASLNGLLRRLGNGLPEGIFPLLSAGAGLATMVVWLIGAGKRHEPARAWLLLGLTTTYLMLFNPMTEINSSVIVGPALALYTVRFAVIGGLSSLGYAVALLGLSLGIFPEIFRPVDRNFGMWWTPLTMLIFAAILIWTVFSDRLPIRNSVEDQGSYSG